MEQDQLDILDREDRIFKSFQAAIDLMACSHSQGVPDTQTLLDFLTEEYRVCRAAMRESIDHYRAM
ncbi:MAG: hypothetical protein ACYC0M_10645 [Burkholderiales bacterium]